MLKGHCDQSVGYDEGNLAHPTPGFMCFLDKARLMVDVKKKITGSLRGKRGVTSRHLQPRVLVLGNFSKSLFVKD